MAKVTRMIRSLYSSILMGRPIRSAMSTTRTEIPNWLVRWTTPDEPQDMTIDVDVSGPGSAQATIHCKIVDLDENPPPNPVADDRNDSFTPSPGPRPAGENLGPSGPFGIPWWQEYWVWHGDDEDRYWCDHGWWESDLDRYSASFPLLSEITPDEKNPTASDSTMKSGYGSIRWSPPE